MTFGEALEALKMGNHARRAGVDGALLFLQLPDRNSPMTVPYIAAKMHDNSVVPWTQDHAGVLAGDWFVPEFDTLHTDDAGAL